MMSKDEVFLANRHKVSLTPTMDVVEAEDTKENQMWEMVDITHTMD